ncbi:MAG TPA: hypothetical protein DCF41_01005 [Arcobacter skirrowii]|nr:hypothetical protein [Aliarcobacter skirrowii]
MSDIVVKQDINSSEKNNLTFQEYQSIYNELTNKVESLRKRFQKSFILEKTHVQHLHEIIKTVNSQYKIVSLNTNVVVYQSDKTKKTYSSIENFLKIDTLIKATESIQIEYNILIDSQNINKKQNYKISILLVSDLISFEKIRDEIPIEIVDLIEKDNISINIEYIDYIVAKNYLNYLNDWVDDISDKVNPLDEQLSKNKYKIANILKLIVLTTSICLVISYIPKYIMETETNMQVLVKYLIYSMLIFYISEKISVFVSYIVKKSLIYLNNYSAIIFTTEDKKNYDIYKNSRKRRIRVFAMTFVLTIVYGVISSIIATTIMEKDINGSIKKVEFKK